ncbi:MAG TPA: phosphoribosylformylglycinamidine cyclo-ligase [Nitrospira sp.]|nr:phosphoribosylformylglycinamidine cyclo-ligase [Nitrospira sp.]
MTTYREAGVDIEAGDEFVDRIKPLVRSTFRPEVLTDLGGFGGLFGLRSDKYKEPVLVSGTDGVGTKLKLAFMMDRHDTVGIDLVAMCVNDIAVSGAEPLFFLDYFATGKLSVEKAQEVVKGIAEGCRQAGCALIGGETAEMPSMYADGEYDLAGFAVGVVEKGKLVDGKTITAGDAIIGLASTGLHSNGYSLARRVLFDQAKLSTESQLPELDRSLGEVLLAPTRIYAKQILSLIQECPIKGIAHITGGGITENLPRVFPEGVGAKISRKAWPVPPIFDVMSRLGSVSREEMYRVFNMGIGLMLVVPPDSVADVLAQAAALGDRGWRIGEMVFSGEKEPEVEYVD